MSRFFTKRMIAAVLCVCMVLPLCACSSDKPEQKQIFAMDTVMTLTVSTASSLMASATATMPAKE